MKLPPALCKRRIFVTGAGGYIGSHTVLALLAAGYDVVALDNFSNSTPRAIAATETLAQRLYGRSFVFVQADVRDVARVAELLRQRCCDAAIHFAALKASKESVEQPLTYYDNNLTGAIALLRALSGAGIFRLVFSSSATVYGDPVVLPVRESAPCVPTNPYGRSKLMIEQVLADLVVSDARWQMGVLRYFNPVGAHESGEIGEEPRGVPNNLMPVIAEVAAGWRPLLNVFGDDWPTPDGTAVRDYLHVIDLAEAHVAAVRRLLREPAGFTVNLGTGKGVSVLEMVRVFEQASGRRIALHVAPRRPGDVAVCYADPLLAEELLGWRARRTLQKMCADTWRWQEHRSRRPPGHEGLCCSAEKASPAEARGAPST
jgi:UDP-glucose 4-epimerase